MSAQNLPVWSEGGRTAHTVPLTLPPVPTMPCSHLALLAWAGAFAAGRLLSGDVSTLALELRCTEVENSCSRTSLVSAWLTAAPPTSAPPSTLMGRFNENADWFFFCVFLWFFFFFQTKAKWDFLWGSPRSQPCDNAVKTRPAVLSRPCCLLFFCNYVVRLIYKPFCFVNRSNGTKIKKKYIYIFKPIGCIFLHG